MICEADFVAVQKRNLAYHTFDVQKITGMAVGFLVEEGKLELSENIYKIFSR